MNDPSVPSNEFWAEEDTRPVPTARAGFDAIAEYLVLNDYLSPDGLLDHLHDSGYRIVSLGEAGECPHCQGTGFVWVEHVWQGLGYTDRHAHKMRCDCQAGTALTTPTCPDCGGSGYHVSENSHEAEVHDCRCVADRGESGA